MLISPQTRRWSKRKSFLKMNDLTGQLRKWLKEEPVSNKYLSKESGYFKRSVYLNLLYNFQNLSDPQNEDQYQNFKK